MCPEVRKLEAGIADRADTPAVQDRLLPWMDEDEGGRWRRGQQVHVC